MISSRACLFLVAIVVFFVVTLLVDLLKIHKVFVSGSEGRDLITSYDIQSRELKELKEQVHRLSRALQDKESRASIATPTLPPSWNEVTSSEDLILDLDDFPALVGPRMTPVNTSISLVVICIGKSDKERVDELTKYFPLDSFTYLLFHYDNSTWDEFSWYNSRNVVAIRVLHKMKYWYLKRFLTPNMAKAFSHIIILDADVYFVPPFDPHHYIRVAEAFNLVLSQPAHARDISITAHRNLYMRPGDQIGRYTDVIECGPAVFLSSKGYQCIYNLMQPDLTSGWGLGMLWVDYVRNVCGFGNSSAAVMDKFLIVHDTSPGHGTASSLQNFNNGAYKEQQTLYHRFPNVKPGHTNRDVPFGFANCLNTKNPAQPQSCE